MKNNNIVILKIGGSVLFPELLRIDNHYIAGLRQTLNPFIQQGKRFILIAGGGAIARWYMQYAREKLSITDESDLSKIGAACTRVNAEILRSSFGEMAYGENYCDYVKDINWTEPVLVASAWLPGKSTNMDSVELAKKYKANKIIVCSDVDYIYTADPDEDPDAEPVPSLTWAGYEEIIKRSTTPDKHIPGIHIPFDHFATQEAKASGLTVIFCRGTDHRNLELILSEGDYKGTTIKD